MIEIFEHSCHELSCYIFRFLQGALLESGPGYVLIKKSPVYNTGSPGKKITRRPEWATSFSLFILIHLIVFDRNNVI